ncbi:TRAP transporter large permease [Dehalococcoidia bacterium]|nr:TRAP transporter large permease [Dehalococcoidia bacterium]
MLIMIFLLFLLMGIGMPVWMVLSSVAFVGLFMHTGGNIEIAVDHFPWLLWTGSAEFLFTPIALFVFMAVILEQGKVGHYIYDIAGKWFSRLPGGLGISTIAASATFAALSGSSVGTAATVGYVAYPEMSRRGYSKKLIAGIISAGGGLGMLIPPSVPLIIYGSITGESIGRLFMAGVIPGLILASFYALRVASYAWQGEIKVVERPAGWRERFRSLQKGFWGLAIIPIVLGGLYTGFFTPGEAGAVGVVMAIVVTVGIYRTITVKMFPSVIREGVNLAVMIYALILSSSFMAFTLTLYRVPYYFSQWIVGIDVPPILIIVGLNLLFIILGCFFSATALMVVTVPIVYPAIIALGFDGTWFAILLMINFNLAVATPPVGLNLYVLKGIAPDMSIEDIIKGVVPFYICEIAGLLLVLFIPALALWLPNTMM